MRVLIADDHSIVRSGLSHLLAEVREDVQVVAATTLAQVRQLLDQDGAFDLIVMDLRMPGMGGLDDVAEVVNRVAPVPVVVFSANEDPAGMRDALARGVRAYVPKSTDDVLVINIFRLVLAGGVYMPPVVGGLATDSSIAAEPYGSGNGVADGGPFAGLTRRQMEVLSLMAEGLSNQEIGERLGLNLSTVKTHVTGVLKALNVASRTQAVLLVKGAGR